MSANTWLTNYQRNKDVFFLKKKEARDKYKKPEERIKKITYEKNKYHNMTKEQKNKKRIQKKNRNCNMTEEEKERRKEYGRNRYCMMLKVC